MTTTICNNDNVAVNSNLETHNQTSGKVSNNSANISNTTRHGRMIIVQNSLTNEHKYYKTWSHDNSSKQSNKWTQILSYGDDDTEMAATEDSCKDLNIAPGCFSVNQVPALNDKVDNDSSRLNILNLQTINDKVENDLQAME